MLVSMFVLASGRGARLGGEVPKAYVRCRGQALVVRSVARLRAVNDHAEIILAVHPADRETYLEPLLPELEDLGLDHIVDGGATRQDSMTNALRASRPDATLVLVHDAARPFFPIEATQQALALAAEVGGAVLAHPAPDTLKRVDANGQVVATIDRTPIWLAQTPQVAQRAMLVAALEQAELDGFHGTDDASLLEHAGYPVAIVASSSTNLKITTPDDLQLAEALAAHLDRGDGS